MLNIITCVLGTLGFSILLKVSRRKLILSVLGGALSAVSYFILIQKGSTVFTATFIAMVCISVYSEILARATKTPSNVILLPSTIPLLPGGALYYSLSYLIHGDKSSFAHYAGETALTGLGIALGAIVVSIAVTFTNGIVSAFVKKRDGGRKS